RRGRRAGGIDCFHAGIGAGALRDLLCKAPGQFMKNRLLGISTLRKTAVAFFAGLTLFCSACAHGKGSAPAPPQAPVVVVAPPQRGTIARTLTLPGDLVGFYQSTLYAKVTGYLKTIS